MDDINMDMDNMSSLRPQTYLFGCELKADKEYLFKVNDDENEHQLSLRTVSLGAGAKDELHVVEAEAMNYEGKQITVTLATLKMSVQPTVSLGGFEITPPVTLRLKCGSGPVHVSGQHLVAMEEEPESDDEDEDIMVSKNIKKRAANMAGSKVPQKKAKLSKDEDEDDDEDDEDEEDEDDEDDEEDEEEEDEEEEEEEGGKKGTKAVQDTSAKKTPKSNQNGKDAKLLAAKVKTLDPPKVKRPPPPKTPPKSFTLDEIKAKMSASVQKITSWHRASSNIEAMLCSIFATPAVKGATLPKTEAKFENYVKNCFRADDKKVIKDLWQWRQSL